MLNLLFPANVLHAPSIRSYALCVQSLCVCSLPVVCLECIFDVGMGHHFQKYRIIIIGKIC